MESEMSSQPRFSPSRKRRRIQDPSEAEEDDDQEHQQQQPQPPQAPQIPQLPQLPQMPQSPQLPQIDVANQSVEIIELSSDDDHAPEVINLSSSQAPSETLFVQDDEDDDDDEIQVLNVNTINPTPLSSASPDPSSNPTQDHEIQITGERQVSSPIPRLHTPVGDIPLAREDAGYTIVSSNTNTNNNRGRVWPRVAWGSNTESYNELTSEMRHLQNVQHETRLRIDDLLRRRRHFQREINRLSQRQNVPERSMQRIQEENHGNTEILRRERARLREIESQLRQVAHQRQVYAQNIQRQQGLPVRHLPVMRVPMFGDMSNMNRRDHDSDEDFDTPDVEENEEEEVQEDFEEELEDFEEELHDLEEERREFADSFEWRMLQHNREHFPNHPPYATPPRPGHGQGPGPRQNQRPHRTGVHYHAFRNGNRFHQPPQQFGGLFGPMGNGIIINRDFRNAVISRFYEGEDEQEIEQNIMRRIEEDNNRMMDNRIAREATYNKKITEEKRKIAEAEKSNHTNDINSTDHLVCELCNIVLGEGVAEDFKGDSRYDEKLEHYCEEYQCQAPWFCVYPFTQVDQELSKRIFVAKCGHMFCGRCVKNIGNRPRRKSKDTKMSVLNPNISSPSTCPEPDCGKKFTAKSFTEVYY